MVKSQAPKDPLNILIANAAATAFKPPMDTRQHHLEKTFAITVNALVAMVQQAADLMRGRTGKIVTISGIDARRYVPLHGALAAAKSATEVLTATWRANWRRTAFASTASNRVSWIPIRPASSATASITGWQTPSSRVPP